MCIRDRIHVVVTLERRGAVVIGLVVGCVGDRNDSGVRALEGKAVLRGKVELLYVARVFLRYPQRLESNDLQRRGILRVKALRHQSYHRPRRWRRLLLRWYHSRLSLIHISFTVNQHSVGDAAYGIKLCAFAVPVFQVGHLRPRCV